MKTQILLSVCTNTTFIGHAQVSVKAEAATKKSSSRVAGEKLSKETKLNQTETIYAGD